MSRLCPDCSLNMSAQIFHGLALDVCPQCAGIWFDQDELSALLNNDPRCLIELEEKTVPTPNHQTFGGPTRIECPDCSESLDEYHYLYSSSLILNSCPECGGIWVQEGELKKLIEIHNQSHEETLTAQQRAAIATAEMQGSQANHIARYRSIQRFCQLLLYFPPYGRGRFGWF